MMDGYVNLQTNKNTLCYNHVLGFCSENRCRFKHVPKHQVPLEFAKRICQVVEPGARWLGRNETPAPGYTDNNTLGKREGPPDGSGPSSPPKKGMGAGKGAGDGRHQLAARPPGLQPAATGSASRATTSRCDPPLVGDLGLSTAPIRRPCGHPVDCTPMH